MESAILVVRLVLLESAVMVMSLIQEAAAEATTEVVVVVQALLVAVGRHIVMELYVRIRHIPLLLHMETELPQYHICNQILKR